MSTGRHDPDSFDIRASVLGIVDAARYQKKVVLLTCLLTLGFVTVYSFVWPPIYTATAVIMVERDTDPVRDTFYGGWSMFRKDDARTEIELVTSGSVLAEVVRREKLTYDDVYHPFSAHLSYLWQKSAPGRAWRWLKASVWAADPQAVADAEALERARTIVDLREGITIEPVAESNVGRLTVKGPSRKVAAIANTLCEVYLVHRAERHEMEARKSYDVLKEQVARVEKDLQAAQARRLEFALTHNAAFDFHKENLEIAKLTDLEESITTARSKIAADEASLRQIDALLEQDPPTRTPAAIREATKVKRMELETALIQARLHYREDSPEVRDILAGMEKLDAMIAAGAQRSEAVTGEGLSELQQELVSRRNMRRTDIEATRAGLRVIEKRAADLRARLADVPSRQAQLKELDREFLMAQEVYQLMQGKVARVVVGLATAAATMPSMRVVDRAVPPLRKSWPKPVLLYPAALGLGLALGLGAALVWSYADGRVQRWHVAAGRGSAPLYAHIAVPAGGRTLVVVPRTGTGGPHEG